MTNVKKIKPRQTLGELRQLQRLAGSVIMRPLARDWRMQRQWIDHRDMREVTQEFIKPNDRLTSFERIEIYNRQYWFRLIDSLYDDFPGLLAVVGQAKFSPLVRAYLTEYPSRSYTMRNLGSRLPQFIQEHPKSVAPRYAMALEMAKFEWAHIEAFDGPNRGPISVDDLLGKDPAKLRLGLQPNISIMKLRYPLDDFVIQLKRKPQQGEASNAMEEFIGEPAKKKKRRITLPRARTTYVAIHRVDNSVYYKRLDAAAYRLLTALRDGATLAKALSQSFKTPSAAASAKEWFETWSALGWFCKPR
jgi:hypothetical protein